MARVDERLAGILAELGNKPPDDARASVKKRYSELVSQAVAEVFAGELRERGLHTALPAPPGEVQGSGSGAERRMSGGIGAKKVDVTWSTEESGLLLAISVKTINFRDGRSGTFQKNLTNRRGDMLFEAVTLHRKFPYAVLAGFFILDHEAAKDATARRKSTFNNAHLRLKIFTGRADPAGRDEQYERLYVVLMNASSADAPFQVYLAGHPEAPVSLDAAFDELLAIVAERDPDFYELDNGALRRV
jgi:hypothetical protein